jgi:hypothetical protein
MIIKKLGGSFVAAMAILALSAPAMAGDCTDVAYAIKAASTNLICGDADANWTGPAIWQWKGKGELGCAVHEKLAKQLFVLHDEPPLGRGKGKGFRLAKGAANALLDHKYEDALLHLQNFWDTIEYNAKLNSDNPDAAAQAEAQQALAMDFMSMIDPVLGCTAP